MQNFSCCGQENCDCEPRPQRESLFSISETDYDNRGRKLNDSVVIIT